MEVQHDILPLFDNQRVEKLCKESLDVILDCKAGVIDGDQSHGTEVESGFLQLSAKNVHGGIDMEGARDEYEGGSERHFGKQAVDEVKWNRMIELTNSKVGKTI